jgi:LacI family transcriptional regulator
MPNIQDVARLAQVSPMTVSRVLNNSAPVKEETRQRVEEAIESLNYLPNRLARSMVSQSGANIFALVMPDIINPFYTGVARGAEDTARKSNYTLIICNHDDDAQKELEYLRTVLSLKVDGCLLIPSGDKTKKSMRLLADHNCPLVLIDRHPSAYEGDYVAGDSIQGAVDLVGLFASGGHRRIAFINGPASISTARDRFFGYKFGIEQNRMKFDPELVYTGENFDPKIAVGALDHFLALANPPTAVLAANNFIAMGFIRAVRERGMDIPAHFALACFDKIEPMDLVKPTITMAIQPAYNFGTIATQLLLEKLDGVPIETPRKIILRPEIVIGESTRNFVHKKLMTKGQPAERTLGSVSR